MCVLVSFIRHRHNGHLVVWLMPMFKKALCCKGNKWCNSHLGQLIMLRLSVSSDGKFYVHWPKIGCHQYELVACLVDLSLIPMDCNGQILLRIKNPFDNFHLGQKYLYMIWWIFDNICSLTQELCLLMVTPTLMKQNLLISIGCHRQILSFEKQKSIW